MLGYGAQKTRTNGEDGNATISAGAWPRALTRGQQVERRICRAEVTEEERGVSITGR